MSSMILSGDTSGAITVTVPAVAGTNTITFPASTGTVVTTGTPATGNVLQVVNATYSTTVASTSTTFADTGLTASITPKFSTSKILVLATVNGVQKNATNTALGTQLLRNSTNITQIDGLGTYTNSAQVNSSSVSINYLDSPATTSATTYKVQFNNQTGTGTVQVQAYYSTISVSSITLMEIAG